MLFGFPLKHIAVLQARGSKKRSIRVQLPDDQEVKNVHLIASRQINSSNWWLVALQGVVTAIIGILIVVLPKPTLAIFIYLFGAFAVIDGLVAIALAISGMKEVRDRWVHLLKGLIGVVVGIVIFVNPEATGVLLAYLIATWALLMGLVQIAHAFLTGYSLAQRLVDALTGVLCIALAVFLYVHPANGVLFLTWLIGAFCIVYGTLLLIRVMFPGKAANISSEAPKA